MTRQSGRFGKSQGNFYFHSGRLTVITPLSEQLQEMIQMPAPWGTTTSRAISPTATARSTTSRLPSTR